MTDYGHALEFGAFLTPAAAGHETVSRLAGYADDIGLDLIGVQDHPYQAAFLDTWTLLSYLAARTRRVRLFPDVANLPLRPPAVLARSAASLDILSGGRAELGLGAGAFTDGVAAMGGPRRAAGEGVAALAEAIEVIRALWGRPLDRPGQDRPGQDRPAGDQTGRGIRMAGEHYRLAGAHPGPVPPHPIGIWVGSYQPRMLRLTGRLADGWLPSSAYAAPDQIAGMTKLIDAAAEDTGRDPAAIRRIYNISGRFAGRGGAGFLDGPPGRWADQLTELALEYGMSGFILAPGPDAERDLRILAEEVAPRVREAVERARRRDGDGPETSGAEAPAGPPALVTASASPSGAAGRPGRPHAPKGDWSALAPQQRARAQQLVQVHDHLRKEMTQIEDVIDQVAAGQAGPEAARSVLNQLTMRQNYWTLGAFCASYCRLLTLHHTIEDEAMFPELVRGQESLAPVIRQLSLEHEEIAGILTSLDAALVDMMEDSGKLAEVRDHAEQLSALLGSHLDYEEEELLEPLGRLDIAL
jgi:alkanesulfonate monooxygenase SsuD/methylene tetrahydromethanopterin reductase-like flavin-dependent oxidoreductase (luciferase family)/hemerythrin-like domain-containing protein